MCLHIQHMCACVCMCSICTRLTVCACASTFGCECVFVYALLHSGLHNELTGCGLCINQNYKYGCRTRATFPFGSRRCLIYVWHHLGTGGEPLCNGWSYYLVVCYIHITSFSSSFVRNKYFGCNATLIGGQIPAADTHLFIHSLNSKSLSMQAEWGSHA